MSCWALSRNLPVLAVWAQPGSIDATRDARRIDARSHLSNYSISSEWLLMTPAIVPVHTES